MVTAVAQTTLTVNDDSQGGLRFDLSNGDKLFKLSGGTLNYNARDGNLYGQSAVFNNDVRVRGALKIGTDSMILDGDNLIDLPYNKNIILFKKTV